MDEKENFYRIITEVRSVVADGENLKCTCPNTYCEWFGDCTKCVAQHRYYGNHLPTCLQPIINEKIKLLAGAGELLVTEKPRNPKEYWDYVREKDAIEQNKTL